jgi:predicted ester cyclase
MNAVIRERTRAIVMSDISLAEIYRAYLACLNKQNWSTLDQFVDAQVKHNGRVLGVSGYREMLEQDFRDIPDLHFEAQLLVCEPPFLASRLQFDCAPKGEFLGLQVGGKRISFAENVFYEFRGGKICEVWSVIDKVAIEAQL